MLPWLLLALTGAGLLSTLNAMWPRRRPAWLAVASFFPAWLVAELPLHALAFQLLGAAALVGLGALATWPGWVGLSPLAISAALLIRVHRRAELAQPALRVPCAEALGEAMPARPRPRVLLPFPVTDGRVRRERDRVYAEVDGRPLRLDLFRPRGAAARPLPILVFLHGGGWMIGTKDNQGFPLLTHMAARGWLCVNVDYRLSPAATFPDHVIDVKRALAWVRAHAAELGGDPSFVALSGNSAGGHLAALAALTPDARAWKPGFEDADVGVDACVPIYGVYDLLDRHRLWPHGGARAMIARHVLKTEDDAVFEAASPLAHVRPDAPPFLIVHGDRDQLVPVESARRFAEALALASRQPVAYAEIPDANHAFEIFRSPRCLHAVAAIGDFLDAVRRRAAAGARGG